MKPNTVQMKPMRYGYHLIPLIVFLYVGCEPSQIDDTEVTPSQCLTDVDQHSLWQRLGTPNSLSTSNQVAPSLIVFNNELLLYYSQRTGLTDTVTVIRSTDGVFWSDPRVIDSLSEFSDIMHMHVSLNDEGFVAHIGGGRIGVAYSIDGIEWGTPDIQIVPTDEFDALGQLYPALNEDATRMWLTGFNGQSYSVGTAEKIDGVWENQGAILEADLESPFENRAVGQMNLLKTEDGFKAWYGGYDTSETDPGPWRILSATSTDGLVWTGRQLALGLTDSGDEAWSVREPSLTLWNGTLWMAYIGMGDDGQYRLKLATCD